MTASITDIQTIAQRGATLNVKLTNDDLTPILLILDQNDEIGIYLLEVSKSDIVDTIAEQLEINDAKAYGLVVEAFATEICDVAINDYNYRVRDMPPDDIYEAVQIVVVERNKGIVSSSIATINRPDAHTKELEPWMDSTETAITSESMLITQW